MASGNFNKLAAAAYSSSFIEAAIMFTTSEIVLGPPSDWRRARVLAAASYDVLGARCGESRSPVLSPDSKGYDVYVKTHGHRRSATTLLLPIQRVAAHSEGGHSIKVAQVAQVVRVVCVRKGR